MLSKATAVALLCLLPSCQLLDTEVPVFDQATGEQIGVTTVGDLVADSGEDVAGDLVGMLTGNPILSGAAAAAAAGLFSGARRKRKQPTVEQEASA
jgi:hypothetical protein